MLRDFLRSVYTTPVLVLLLILGFMSLPGTANCLGLHVSAATTFVVTNTNDSGAGSLRQAILDANTNPGLDTISFNIGSGPQTITPLQRLPTVTDAVVIDGTTQPGFSGTPIIELNGSLQPDGNGLFITGGSTIVRSLVINRFHFCGILIDTNGGNRIEGCYIGTDITGIVAEPNGFTGISIRTSNNVIGGINAAQRNVISGNIGAGIDISRPCCTGDLSSLAGNVIQGNYIGVNATGSAAVTNTGEGVRITGINSGVPATSNLIGGTQPGAGNVVSGNRIGISLQGFFATNNTVQGNFVGTDVTGSFAIPNDGDGISVTGSNNLIGGPTAGARNVVSGNGNNGSGVEGGNGVSLIGDSVLGNVVQGNIIGANAALNAALPNLQHGVALTGSNSIIGGTNIGEGNIIAFNGFDGIVDATNSSSTRNSFRGNSIFSNGLVNHPSGVTIGIDLGNNGVTPNDQGDGDAGANNLQNFPVINSVATGPSSVNLKGTLNSTGSTSFSLDFYANSVCDPSGFGEGARFIGSAIVTTNASGDASFDLNFTVTLPPGQVFTATATDPTGNTSEFSQCSVSANAVGSVGFRNKSVAVNESDELVTFVVDRSGGSLGALSISYNVTNQSAREGFDFAPTQGTLSFADGETSKMFTVPVMEDSVDESLETAKVTLGTSGDLGTVGSQSTATLNIIDNDPQPTVSIGDLSAAEGDSGTTDFNFPVTLSVASERPVTVSFATQDGTAVGGGDDFFFPITNSITIGAGQTSVLLTIKVIGDTNIESDETFFVNLFTADNATVADGQGQATIRNDDAVPTVSLSVNDVSVSEGNSGTTDAIFTVTLSAVATNTVTVDILTFGDTASSGQDFVNVFPTLTFAPGETTKTLAVPVVGDNIFEGNETFRVELRNAFHATISDGVGIGTIIDDEQQPTLSVNDITITEGDSATKDAVFTVSLSGISSNSVSFGFGLANGTAIEQEDFSGVSGGGLIVAGLTSTNITVPIIGDTISESNETFFLNISAPANATISDNQGMATIIDDESSSKPSTVQFSVRRPSVSEGGKNVVIEVTRSGDLSTPATVQYGPGAPSSASDRTDFSPAFGKLSFAAGDASETFSVFITDDVFVEGPENFLVTLSNSSGGASLGEPIVGVVQIIDNDTSPPNSNPTDDASFFVRQHYVDFLNREADASGLAFWTNQITECQQPGATCSAEVRRINVSAAFFLSIEFQETGYLVYRMYKASYGNITGTPVPVRLSEFLPDTQQIGKDFIFGQPGAEQQLENNKVAFALDFVTRSRFTTAYPTTMTPAQFVDALFTNAGVTPSTAERDAAINEFGGAANTVDVAARSRALRRVAENSTLKQQEFNRAFVLMEYFGYLRRNPNDPPEANLDFGGYNFWLGKLEQFNGNFVNAEMVKAFLVSSEYRNRFGP